MFKGGFNNPFMKFRLYWCKVCIVATSQNTGIFD